MVSEPKLQIIQIFSVMILRSPNYTCIRLSNIHMYTHILTLYNIYIWPQWVFSMHPQIQLAKTPNKSDSNNLFITNTNTTNTTTTNSLYHSLTIYNNNNNNFISFQVQNYHKNSLILYFWVLSATVSDQFHGLRLSVWAPNLSFL